MVAPRRRMGRRLSRHVARAAGAAGRAPGDIAALIAASAAGRAGADGEDLRRFRAEHRARHDALAASALLRLFPRQRRAGLGGGRISGHARWPRNACCGRRRPPRPSSRRGCIDWLRQALGLPDGFSGVIQDSASSATLAAVLTMRERALEWPGNQRRPRRRSRGCASIPPTRSTPRSTARSGCRHRRGELVRIPTGGRWRAMDPAALEAAIDARPRRGLAAGRRHRLRRRHQRRRHATTSRRSARSRARHGLYLHVDAAWAGSAMICPEFRHFWTGVEEADSVVFNPHKWLGAQFDCSVHFIRKPEDLVRTLAIKPEFLKTHGQRRHHQLFRMDRAARPPLPRAEALVPAARPRAGRPARR